MSEFRCPDRTLLIKIGSPVYTGESRVRGRSSPLSLALRRPPMRRSRSAAASIYTPRYGRLWSRRLVVRSSRPLGTNVVVAFPNALATANMSRAVILFSVFTVLARGMDAAQKSIGARSGTVSVTGESGTLKGNVYDTIGVVCPPSPGSWDFPAPARAAGRPRALLDNLKNDCQKLQYYVTASPLAVLAAGGGRAA
ncbi:hypothetical protein EVAR_21447_1 [Eumeta japonica]|uniref:Uncharacterized protein n=1 Tax=Eumeta variegata TaxID=151549 RepID=A0A4C1VHF8_EUMVA|nr:hypothetical protein EVAR_21447_1 [Eumeta japonica]